MAARKKQRMFQPGIAWFSMMIRVGVYPNVAPLVFTMAPLRYSIFTIF
jgi:hypothetical protein